MCNIGYIKNKKKKNAICIGSLCFTAYLSVYFAKNILGAVTPEMIERGYSAEFIGRLSSLCFLFYAVGQLVNGIVGDRIKARYMICVGLSMAGAFNLLFCFIVDASPYIALPAYGVTGFFLSMIYGPMTKMVAENMEPVYATRCSLGYTFASFLGSSLAGAVAAMLTWRKVLVLGSIFLGVMTASCFTIFGNMEKKGIIWYGRYARKKESGKGIGILIRHGIIKFTMISMLTGIVRTTVVFWMPTYICQFLGFPTETVSLIFAAATLVISTTVFITIFIYERLLKGNMDLTILIMFISAALFFFLLEIVRQPALNIACLVLGIMSSNGAACMLWSKYCPGLRDTGMVSGAVGFLDFASYLAAAVSSALFADAISAIGWEGLIMVWFFLMVAGVLVSIPYKEIRKRQDFD